MEDPARHQKVRAIREETYDLEDEATRNRRNSYGWRDGAAP